MKRNTNIVYDITKTVNRKSQSEAAWKTNLKTITQQRNKSIRKTERTRNEAKIQNILNDAYHHQCYITRQVSGQMIKRRETLKNTFFFFFFVFIWCCRCCYFVFFHTYNNVCINCINKSDGMNMKTIWRNRNAFKYKQMHRSSHVWIYIVVLFIII